MNATHKLVVANISAIQPGELFYYEAPNYNTIGLRVRTAADGAENFIKIVENGALSLTTELFPADRTEAISFGKNFEVKLSSDLLDWRHNSDLPYPGYPSVALGESGELYLIVKNAQGNRMCINLATGDLIGSHPKAPYATISKSEIHTTAINEDPKVLVILN